MNSPITLGRCQTLHSLRSLTSASFAETPLSLRHLGILSNTPPSTFQSDFFCLSQPSSGVSDALATALHTLPPTLSAPTKNPTISSSATGLWCRRLCHARGWVTNLLHTIPSPSSAPLKPVSPIPSASQSSFGLLVFSTHYKSPLPYYIYPLNLFCLGPVH